MIITIPEAYAQMAYFPSVQKADGEELFHTSLTKSGLLFYCDSDLIGQLFFDKISATVSSADSFSHKISAVNSQINITTLIYTPKELVSVNSSEQRKPSYNYFCVGNVNGNNYSLYQKNNGEVKPLLVATVIPSISDRTFKVNINEDFNVIKIFATVVAINRLLH